MDRKSTGTVENIASLKRSTEASAKAISSRRARPRRRLNGRAARRCGQLLAMIEKGKGGSPHHKGYWWGRPYQ